MAQLKVTVDPAVQSGDLTKDEVMALANQNTPSDVIPSADVIRDASGKLVQVNVNLPDTAADAAEAAIAAHNGVAKINSNLLTLINDSFTSLADGDVDFESGELQSVGGLEVSKKYDSTKSDSLFPSGSVGSMRFIGTGADAGTTIGEKFFLGNVGYFNIKPTSPNFNVAYDGLKVGFKVFFESVYTPSLDTSDPNTYAREGAGAHDYHDLYNTGEDRMMINLGQIQLIFESQPGDTLFGAQDGKRILKAKIGNSIEQQIDLGFAYDEWITISAEYNSSTGLGSVSATVGGNTTTLSYSGLSGLLISSRSANEFRFENVSEFNNLGSTTKLATDGPYQNQEVNNNNYIDDLLIQITSVVGV